MARLAEISYADRAPEGAVQLLVRRRSGVGCRSKGVIDLAAEKARLDKEISKADADIKRVDAKSVTRSSWNAPEDIVEKKRKSARRPWPARQDRRGAGAAEERELTDRQMLDHVSSPYPTSLPPSGFYDAIIESARRGQVGRRVIGWVRRARARRLSGPRLSDHPQGAEARRGVSAATGASSAMANPVDASGRGVAAGGTDDGPPGVRDYLRVLLWRVLRDPDGQRIEAVCHHAVNRRVRLFHFVSCPSREQDRSHQCLFRVRS